jgi:DNA-binding Xre family transcriptional regulator
MLRWFNRNKAPKELKNAVGLSEEALSFLMRI